MTSHRLIRTASTVALATAFVAVAASPAFAQAAGGAGGNIGTFIQNVINLLNNNVIRGLAVVAIGVTSVYVSGFAPVLLSW